MTGGGDGRAHDVFVSCAADGLGWAEWIAAALEGAGHRVTLGAWDEVPGTHRVSWLDGVTQRARRTIAVVSDGYLDSPAVSAEWGAAWSPRIMDGERRLLVARVTDRSIPGLLGQLVPIDLVGRSPLAARALLLAAVRGEAGQVEAVPAVEGGPAVEDGPVEVGRGETARGRTPSSPGPGELG
ncbi:toll/interleukin-1 receptor domain-containing protein, partial [Frankia tisae]|uniref:toll/interleukin-1 receptor domain-containing protein n=1 Tax=Frankia tisae TaxID=2950104 RepID=UPI0021C1437F